MAKGTGSNTAAGGGGRRRYDDFKAGDKHYLHGSSEMNKMYLEDRDAAQSVVRYTDRHYRDINDHLRKGEGAGLNSIRREQVEKMIEGLDRAFERPGSRFQADGAVYRGAVGPLLRSLNEGTLRPGDVFQDKALTSTTISKKVARSYGKSSGEGNAMMRTIVRIRVKKGQRGLHVQSVSQHPMEAETLLPRGAKFKVAGVRVVGMGDRPVRQITLDYM